jgi:phosphoribosylaminoimidazole-succinocarboxamide synthase
MSIIFETDVQLPVFHKGKVRDTYIIDDMLLLIASDRVSAFDVVLPGGIPDKGNVLCQMSAFWFDKTRHIIPNHVVKTIDSIETLRSISGKTNLPDYLAGRSMIVKKAERIPVEAVVRGYISGSAWAEYKESGTVSGIRQPEGLQMSQQLHEPMFTPTTKADSGHDLPLTNNELVDLVGKETAHLLADTSLTIYSYGQKYAQERGIIIADTKFEFGFIDGEFSLIDEVLTPDSSRFWYADQYIPGRSQPSLDKQPIRDWLEDSGWSKEPPAPMLPEQVIKESSERYKMAYYKLVGTHIRSEV